MLYFVIHVLSSYHIVHVIPFSFHYLITHAARISFTRGNSLVLSFPHYLAEHAHFSSLKQLYGLHLCLYIY